MEATKSYSVSTDAFASDAFGDVYVIYNIVSKVILPSISPAIFTSSYNTKAAFIAKIEGTTGNMVWNKTSTGGIFSEIISALTFDVDGNLYAAGYFQNNATPLTAKQQITIGGVSFYTVLVPI